jgi:hypothetical protein
MLTVYHTQWLFTDQGDSLRAALLQEQPITFSRSDLTAVATLDDAEFADREEALSRAYALTQNKDKYWIEHQDIHSLCDAPTRSTSMGDVIEKDGIFWVVAMTSFYPCTVS